MNLDGILAVSGDAYIHGDRERAQMHIVAIEGESIVDGVLRRGCAIGHPRGALAVVIDDECERGERSVLSQLGLREVQAVCEQVVDVVLCQL
ncbi:hypothetical protein ACWZHB_02605 [Nocardia sp. FBN12]|uniref:hypothetical protein n=1 Tax=Nocardia sp. FBN12 TaxID=3419766 RepID=UPI003D004B47